MKNNWIFKRALILVGIYVILLGLVHLFSLQKIHHQYFIKKNNFFFSTYGNGGKVSFLEIPKAQQNRFMEYDVLIKLSSKQQRQRAIKKAKRERKTNITYQPVQYDINSWAVYGMLYVFLVALAIALPLHWKNKLLTLAGSFVLLELFFLLKMWVLLTLKFSIWYKKFEVGWTNGFLIDLLNYFLIIITYPFFGMVFIVIVSLLFSSRSLLLLGKKEL